MAEGTKTDTLLQIVHCIDVIHPAVVYNTEQNHLFDFSHLRSTDFRLFLIVESVEFRNDIFLQLIRGELLNTRLIILHACESVGESLQVLIHQIKIPFFRKLTAYGNRNYDAVNKVFHHFRDVGLDVVSEKNLAALVVNNLSLLIHNIVILKNIFTNFKVAAFYLLLCALYCLGKHSGSQSFFLHSEFIHNALNSLSAEEAHQIVLQGYEELRLTRVSLTTGTTSELIVNTSGFVSFRTDDAKTAELSYLLLFFCSFRLEFLKQLAESLSCV